MVFTRRPLGLALCEHVPDFACVCRAVGQAKTLGVQAGWRVTRVKGVGGCGGGDGGQGGTETVSQTMNHREAMESLTTCGEPLEVRFELSLGFLRSHRHVGCQYWDTACEEILNVHTVAAEAQTLATETTLSATGGDGQAGELAPTMVAAPAPACGGTRCA